MSNEGGTDGRVGDLELREFESRLQTGLGLQLGPFNARIRVNQSGVSEPLYSLYRDYPLLTDENVFSFHARLDEVRRALPWRKPVVRFSVDGRAPHEDMPAAQSLAVLEWGINLVIALRSHCFLMLHAAAVETRGKVLLLPAAPGDGKTTLCAGLVLRGWRLFSDEFGLLRPGTTDVTPVPRPMALKNESIDVIRRFAPAVEMGPAIPNTRKGTVAHVKPPTDSVRRATETAPARLIVFPQWLPGSRCSLTGISPSESFMLVASNAFNYELLGEAGFDTVGRLVAASQSFRLVYSNLDEATETLSRLAEHDEFQADE